MSETFTFFWKNYFSQWHRSSFNIDGVTYNCAEQYMMAEKARLFGDTERESLIMSSPDPAEHQRLGREVQNFDEAIWKANARDIVKRGNYAKYTQNDGLKAALMATGDTTLVEASPEDCIWGIGLKRTDPRAQHRETWLGQNWLGQAITEVREQIRAEGR